MCVDRTSNNRAGFVKAPYSCNIRIADVSSFNLGFSLESETNEPVEYGMEFEFVVHARV